MISNKTKNTSTVVSLAAQIPTLKNLKTLRNHQGRWIELINTIIIIIIIIIIIKGYISNENEIIENNEGETTKRRRDSATDSNKTGGNWL